jgi:hypothetical protein
MWTGFGPLCRNVHGKKYVEKLKKWNKIWIEKIILNAVFVLNFILILVFNWLYTVCVSISGLFYFASTFQRLLKISMHTLYIVQSMIELTVCQRHLL